ncbi:MAG: hypothetical protein BZ136_01565 [Methanosphaera sp. rholeuAM74]|nr:MAG: hypothetical protein BZ136_01565 [Methanosphaera sp. rholeuAM74]
MMDLVVYYSRTENTKKVAECIKDELEADILEVKDKKNRSGPIQFLIGGFDALRGNDTTISYDAVDLKQYDTVYIGTPVWASRPAPAIVKFINENDFAGVNCVTFATMGGSGGEATTNVMNYAIISQGGSVDRSFSIAIKNDSDIEALTKEALENQ